MKSGNKEGVDEENISLVEYINQVANDLKERIEHHRHMVIAFLENPLKEEKVIDDYCVLVDCPKKRIFAEVIEEAIKVLEETRKSFKSRKLEDLRKKMIKTLENL